jgi:REP element-mobilizing transposase RayT
MDDNDHRRFLTMLADSLETYQVVLYAYIMMNNHFHLLVQTRKANCSEFMRHFNIRYTGWFNWRHERSGNLYQGRYHAYLVDADNYLLEVSRYMHLNPVQVKQLKSLSLRERWQKAIDHPWSSLSGYVNDKSVLNFVDYDRLLSIVGGRDGYRKFVRDGLRRGFENPFKHVRNQMILGDSDFASSVKRYLRRVSAREQPAYREMVNVALEPEVVLGLLMRECGISKASLEQRGANGVIRGIVAELLYKYCEITQAQIGHLLGDIDYMSVYQLRGRLKRKMDQDSDVKVRFRELEMKLQQLMSNV